MKRESPDASSCRLTKTLLPEGRAIACAPAMVIFVLLRMALCEITTCKINQRDPMRSDASAESMRLRYHCATVEASGSNDALSLEQLVRAFSVRL